MQNVHFDNELHIVAMFFEVTYQILAIIFSNKKRENFLEN